MHRVPSKDAYRHWASGLSVWQDFLCMPPLLPQTLHVCPSPPSPPPVPLSCRNFGMPMNVEPEFKGEAIWGFKVGIYKDGVKLTDIGIQVGGEGRAT